MPPSPRPPGGPVAVTGQSRSVASLVVSQRVVKGSGMVRRARPLTDAWSSRVGRPSGARYRRDVRPAEPLRGMASVHQAPEISGRAVAGQSEVGEEYPAISDVESDSESLTAAPAAAGDDDHERCVRGA